MVAGILYVLGGALEAGSSLYPLNRHPAGLTVALIGRWIYGLACGFSMHGVGKVGRQAATDLAQTLCGGLDRGWG